MKESRRLSCNASMGNHLSPTSSSSLVLLLLLVPLLTQAAEDPIGNCRPSASDTVLCNDRGRLCADLGYNFTYAPELSCGLQQEWYFNPNVPCQCEVLCVDLIPAGGVCAINMADYPTALCEPGLDCLMTEDAGDGYTCQRNPEKDCVGRLISYEEAVEGGQAGPALMQPSCDGAGQWAGVQCSAQATCYCTNEDGSRLFGEDVYTRGDLMDCKCSLLWSRNAALELPGGPRCLPNGGFDPLQCTPDFCYCLDPASETVVQGPYVQSMITHLECYNATYHSANYTNPCDVALAGYTGPSGGEDEGLLVVGVGKEPLCGPDGFYSAVQPDQTRGGYFCSDRFGRKIEDFSFTRLGDSDCHCATRLHLLTSAGLTSALPQCCPDGSYQQPQTHGLYAYCVDESGNQEGDVTTVTQARQLECRLSPCTHT